MRLLLKAIPLTGVDQHHAAWHGKRSTTASKHTPLLLAADPRKRVGVLLLKVLLGGILPLLIQRLGDRRVCAANMSTLSMQPMAISFSIGGNQNQAMLLRVSGSRKNSAAAN
jgi:hypothetical protein